MIVLFSVFKTICWLIGIGTYFYGPPMLQFLKLNFNIASLQWRI